VTRRRWIVIGTGVLVLGAIGWYGIARSRSGSAPQAASGAASAPGGAAAETRKIRATLFLVSAEGGQLVAVSQDVPYGATTAEQARRLAEAQITASGRGLLGPVPAGTTVRGLYLAPKGAAYLDLSKEVMTGHTGGSLDESLTVYAFVNALTMNLPDVTSVQILVDGRQVDTLAGHVDLRHPLRRSLKWIRKGTSIP